MGLNMGLEVDSWMSLDGFEDFTTVGNPKMPEFFSPFFNYS